MKKSKLNRISKTIGVFLEKHLMDAGIFCISVEFRGVFDVDGVQRLRFMNNSVGGRCPFYYVDLDKAESFDDDTKNQLLRDIEEAVKAEAKRKAASPPPPCFRVWIDEHTPKKRKWILIYNKKTKRVRKFVPTGDPCELAEMGANVTPFTPAYDAVMRKMTKLISNGRVWNSARIENGLWF